MLFYSNTAQRKKMTGLKALYKLPTCNDHFKPTFKAEHKLKNLTHSSATERDTAIAVTQITVTKMNDDQIAKGDKIRKIIIITITTTILVVP